jgi:hypothetical protein
MVSQGLDLELATMQAIATALAQLDPAARARTLQWLRQRFDVDIIPAPQATAPSAPMTSSPLRIVPAPVIASDESLSVETLDDLFDRRAPEPKADATPQSVTGLLSELVAEFQDLARDWDDACGERIEAPRRTRLLSAAS